jgi:peptide/nickel transport system substrate-binding protein
VKRNLYVLLCLLVAGTMVLSACGNAATATEAPVATEPPATEPATTEPAATEAPATEAPATCEGPADAAFVPADADVGEKGITISFEQEPDQAFGLFSNMSFSGWLTQMYAAGLGKWNDKNEFIPELATEIPTTENGGVSADGLTITWKIKPCAFWSDGTPFTSKDVAFTWAAEVDEGNAVISRAGYEKISEVETPDDQTAILHFSELYPGWQTLFTVGPNNLGAILPSHLLEGQSALETNPEIHQPTVAAGPFAIKEWIPGDHLTLVRNPNYHGNLAKLDYINIKFVGAAEAQLPALQAGDVDLAVNFAESDIEAINALEAQGVHLRVDAVPSFEHLFFNLGTTAGVDGKGKSDVDGFCPFQDVNVRKAIALGIDRLSFIKNYLKLDESAFIASLWPNSQWYNTNLTPFPYDPDQANQLLDDAGYPLGSDGIRAGTCNGKEVKFSLGIETTTAQRRIDNVLAIQSDLKKIGIDIKPNHLPAGTFFGTYAEGADMPHGNFDMAIYTTGFYPDPDPGDNFLCKGIPNAEVPSGNNNYHICDPKLDELMAAGLASADPAERKKVYDEIQQYQYDNVLFVPLYARANIYAYQDRFVFPPSSGYGNAFWDTENFDVK